MATHDDKHFTIAVAISLSALSVKQKFALKVN
ncbi:hypothetical protein KLMIMM047B_08790 [Klebsiella michiganensis]|nr:Uncharacterised protein [Klebsiella michiganensis]